MNCILNTTEQEELLLGYCSASLELDTARTYERHLQSCEHCRLMVESQKMLDETLADWQAPAPTSNFDQKLFARIHAEQAKAQSWWQPWLSWKPLVPVALAAMALAFFLIRTPESPQPSDMIQADQIEQAERALDDYEALQALHQPDPTPVGEKESL